MGCKKKIHQFKSFFLIIINVKIFSNFQKNGAHLIEKSHLKKTRIIHSQGLSAFNMQKHFWFVLSFEHVNFANNEKYSKKLWQSKQLCFTCDLSNIQKCNFEKFPLTWVAPLIVILPNNVFDQFFLNIIQIFRKYNFLK